MPNDTTYKLEIEWDYDLAIVRKRKTLLHLSVSSAGGDTIRLFTDLRTCQLCSTQNAYNDGHRAQISWSICLVRAFYGNGKCACARRTNIRGKKKLFDCVRLLCVWYVCPNGFDFSAFLHIPLPWTMSYSIKVWKYVRTLRLSRVHRTFRCVDSVHSGASFFSLSFSLFRLTFNCRLGDHQVHQFQCALISW